MGRGKDVRIGDTVVEKKGEIIPQVVDVVKADRTGKEKVIEWPKTCPKCGGPVEKEETATSYNFICANTGVCPAQLAKRVEGFARRTRMDIDGLGEEVAIQLVDSELVKSIPDLYRLTKKHLLTLEKFGDLKAQNPPRRHAGAKTEVSLVCSRRSRSTWSVRACPKFCVEEFPSLDAIVAAKPEDLARERLRPERAVHSGQYFDNPREKKLVRNSQELGIKTTHEKKAAPAGGLPLAGKTVVVTGTLVNYDRVTIENAIMTPAERLPAASRKRPTTFSSATNPAASSTRPRELGVKIIDEAEFQKLIGK